MPGTTPTETRPANVAAEDWDDVMAPEMTEAEAATARPIGEAPPALLAALKNRGGRPRLEKPKVPVSLRLDPDVLAAFKASGPGWQVRMGEVLAEAARKLDAA